jgi:hypothetical protein
MTTIQARRWAKKEGIPWGRLLSAYRELRILARTERDREWEMRRTAWQKMRPSGSWDFWRHGFQDRYRRAFTGGDQNDIPGFDELAADMGRMFPELAVGGDPASKLFEFLAQPHNTLPTSEETWAEVVELYESGDVAHQAELETVPF